MAALLGLSVAPVGRVAAAPCSSWNLYNDFQTGGSAADPNPDSCGNSSVWYHEYGVAPGHDGTNYTLFTTYSDNFYGESGYGGWYNASTDNDTPLVAKNTNNTAIMPAGATVPAHSINVHPGSGADSSSGYDVVVGWKSPIAGTVSITGGVSDNDGNGGNGIAWYIDRYSGSTNTTLDSGSYPDGGSQTFDSGSGGSSSIAAVSVSPGDYLNFIVDPNGDYSFDSTDLDVTITAQQPAAAPEAPLGVVTLAVAGSAVVAATAWRRRGRS